MTKSNIKTKMEDKIQKKLQRLVQEIRFSQLESFQIGQKVTKILQSIIRNSQDINSLIQTLREVGKYCAKNIPVEVEAQNMVGRLLHIIREERPTIEEENPSLVQLIRGNSVKKVKLDSKTFVSKLIKDTQIKIHNQENFKEIKSGIIRAVEELLTEFEPVPDEWQDQISNLIQDNQVILTYGNSTHVKNFLKESKERKIEIVVCESAPTFSGHIMAKDLAAEGQSVVLISDSEVFAIMSRVNQVIIGTKAVLANGGLLATSGAFNICLAARCHNVPVLVLCDTYQLTPLYPFDKRTFNEHLSPSLIIEGGERAEVPGMDYVPPELISLFVTNQGGHCPQYIYRLLTELYNAQDYAFYI